MIRSKRRLSSVWLLLVASILSRSSLARADAISLFPLQNAAAGPLNIAAGPDGNLWFTEKNADKIGKITPQGIIAAEYVLKSGAQPSGITARPDGNLWFTEQGRAEIGRISPAGANASPTGITLGPDGKIWFTEFGAGMIGRINSVPEPSGCALAAVAFVSLLLATRWRGAKQPSRFVS